MSEPVRPSKEGGPQYWQGSSGEPATLSPDLEGPTIAPGVLHKQCSPVHHQLPIPSCAGTRIGGGY